MPGPAQPEWNPGEGSEDGLPTTRKLQSMLAEQERRIKAHIDQAMDRSWVNHRAADTLFLDGGSPRVPDSPKDSMVMQAKGLKGQVPSYVRNLVEDTLKETPPPAFGKVDGKTHGTLDSSWSDDNKADRWKRVWLAYDMFTMAMIFLYACLLGITQQITSITSEEPLWAADVELAFCIVFSLDLLVRIGVEKIQFVLGAMRWWNMLDFVLVVLMIVSQITPDSFISSMSGLRTLRLLRILRIMRLAKYFARWPQFRQIRILVASIGESSKMMLWLMTLAFSIIYVFSLILTEGVWPTCHEEEHVELLCRKFGTLTKSMLTLYQILYNGVLWGELWDVMQGWTWFFLASYLLYVSFSMIILGNMMASFLFSLQKKVSRKEKEHLIQSEIESKEEFLQQMNSVFQEFDQNGNGAISWTEFQIALEDQRMHAFLSSLELDISDAVGLFSVLDSDGTGAIEHSEFLLGCLRLRGGAKAVDMVRVQMEQEWMHQAMLHQKELMRELLRVTSTRSKALDEFRVGKVASEKSEYNMSGESVLVSDVFHRASESHSFSRHYRTNLQAEERAVTLQELKRISSDALLESRHGWIDQISGKRISTNDLNLYHFSYHHILPTTAPGLVLKLRPSAAVSLPQPGQQIIQHGANPDASLPAGCGTVIEVEECEDGEIEVTVQLSQGRFSTNSADGSVFIEASDFGLPRQLLCDHTFSYKEWLSSEPCRPLWYCSHWWGEPITSFVACCQKQALLRRLEDAAATYWVCGYANRQHELELEIGGDITQSSFYKALNIASGLLLILDAAATPFSRIWCDYELYQSITDPYKELDIVTQVHYGRKKPAGAQLLSKNVLPGESAVAKSVREQNFPLSLLLHGMKVSLENGDATVQKDKESILFEIASQADLATPAGQELLEQNLKRANDSLHSTFAILAWPQAMQRGLLLDFSKGQGVRVKLPEILKADTFRKSLDLSLAHFEETCVDSTVRILAGGLPANLRVLRLSFEGCSKITDASLSALGSHFPENLKRLYLDFIGCVKITDTGLIALASFLPPSLERIELHFAGCSAIGAAGARVLRMHLPRGLTGFSATFKGTGVNRNFLSLDDFHSFS